MENGKKSSWEILEERKFRITEGERNFRDTRLRKPGRQEIGTLIIVAERGE